MTPGEPFTARFSILPFAQMLRTGHRLRLELGSDPRKLGVPWNPYVYFETAGPPYAARNTVLHGGDEPSRLDLTIRGTTT